MSTTDEPTSRDDDEPASRHDHVRSRTRARRTGGNGTNGANRRKLWLVAGGLAALVFVAVGGWSYLQLHPRGGPGEVVTVTVEEGWGVQQVGSELERQGVIGSALVFRLWERRAAFVPGTYALAENLGVVDASAALRRPVASAPEVGVLPGQTVAEVAERVGAIRRLSAARFVEAATDGKTRSRFEPEGVATLEGLLAPESYPVPPETTEADLTETMVSAFDERASALGIEAAASELGRSPYEVIIVASLIQREAMLDTDRPLIAAVIYNRLRAGIPLQIDATSRYAADTGRPEYDTYAIAALPPTPISTVSSQSLAAAMHPADVTYQFYVLADDNGGHVFADTYEEHLTNVEAARAKGLL